MAIAKFLSRLQQIGDLDQDAIEVVQALPWSAISVKRGRDILSVGDRPDYVYVIESGWAARYSIRRDGSRRITGFMLPGDFCGIHAVTEEPMEHALAALSECSGARIAKHVVEEAVAASPAIGKALWRAKLMDEAILRVWLLYSQDATQAVAHLLCELHARSEAIGEVQNGSFKMPLTQEHIGDAMGITAAHTNRVLKQLRIDGLVEILHREVSIPSIEKLRAACAFSPHYLHLPDGLIADQQGR